MKQQILDLFKSFLDGEISKRKLINGLILIEIEKTDLDVIEDYSKELRFRFFKGDNLATTIRNLNTDIDCPTNGEYTLDCLTTALEEPQYFEVNFS